MKNYERVQQILKEKALDGILVSDGYNMRYISGFTGGEGQLVITDKSRILLTDSRYTVAAKLQAPDFEVIQVDNQRGGSYIEKTNEIIASDGIQKLGFEGSKVTFEQYNQFRSKLNCSELVPLQDELEALRVVKTQEEIDNLRMAEHIGDLAFSGILEYIKPGVTELEIAARLEFLMKTNGAEKLSFETIVAAGDNGAKPHAEPGNRTINNGDLVTMDFGCRYNGYCSDMTRTVCVGKANDKQREIYNIVLEAQTAVLDCIKAGKAGREYDKIARDIIGNAGYSECFGHGLGHSVGLEIHENPRLSRGEEKIILPGTIETVEPGIYIAGFGGVRIEDMILVTADGCENFTHSEKKLIEL